jgi:periplasmic copper chaperone A
VSSWFRRNPVEAAVAARGSLEIRRPWIRPDLASPSQAGGYLTVTNNGADPDRLVGVHSPAAESIEIHAIKVVGCDIKMQPRANGLAVAAGLTMTLKPRGYHLLLRGLKATPSTGATVPATLVFEKAGSIDIEFSVEEPGMVGKDILDEERHRG